MKLLSSFPIWSLCLFLPAAVTGQDAGPASPAVAVLGWLEGSWSGTKEGVTSEEHWTSAAGGALVGLHKDVREGRMISFEFLRIVTDEQGRVCYLASPGGSAPTAFCVVELGERRVVFENRQHDFPQRILYWQDAAGRLHARIEGPMNGQELSEEWIWSRAAR